MWISLLLMLAGLAMPASAGYETVTAGVRLDDTQVEWADGLLARDARTLLRDGALEITLSDNALPMDMFRRAAAMPNKGDLLAKAPDRPTTMTPGPDYGPHLKIFRLLLLDARRKAASGGKAGSEANLLAAAGFIAQLSAQRDLPLPAAAVLASCAEMAYPFLAESLRGRAPSPSYMRGLASRLDAAYAALPGLASAMSSSSAELSKNLIRENVNPEKAMLERGMMPFYSRYAYRRLQNDDYFSLVYSRFDAAAEARAAALLKALEANDPASAENFVKDQISGLAAKDAHKGKLGLTDAYKVSVGDAHEVRSAMADSMVHMSTARDLPEYWRMVPGYNGALARLGVLRAALAAKEYQRRRGRLPDSLEKLVPSLIPSVPKDPFGGFAPVSYSRSGRGFSVRAGGIVYED